MSIGVFGLISPRVSSVALRSPPSHRYPLCRGYFDRYLPLSDAHPPLPPLSIRLQERCMLSTSLRHASPFLSQLFFVNHNHSALATSSISATSFASAITSASAPVISDHSPAPSLRPSRMLGYRSVAYNSISEHCGVMWCTWRRSRYGVWRAGCSGHWCKHARDRPLR